MIRRYLQRRRLRRLFKPFLSPEGIEAVVSGNLPSTDPPPLTPAPLEFVIAAVRGTTPDEVAQRMGAVAELAGEHGGVADTLVSSVVVAVFGTISFDGTAAAGRLSFLASLRENFGADFRAVHGAAQGHYGCLGSGNCLSYSFIVPGFVEALGALAEVRFGDAIEVSHTRGAA
jgi:hypothetical protein